MIDEQGMRKASRENRGLRRTVDNVVDISKALARLRSLVREAMVARCFGGALRAREVRKRRKERTRRHAGGYKEASATSKAGNEPAAN